MTGFGAASLDRDGDGVSVELRSVNSRHLKLSFRLPEGKEAWEPGIRAAVAERIHRGHVTVRVALTEPGPGTCRLELDEARVRAYLDAIAVLQAKFGLKGEPDLALLLGLGDVLRERREEAASGPDEATVRKVLEKALSALVAMREAEGHRLEEELRSLAGQLRRRLEIVGERAPERIRRERDRLRAAIHELASGVELDEERLEREVAVAVERWDIREELVRATAHLDAFEEFLDRPGGEPVGKRLAFLVQELHREINTVGAKANDAEITREVVEMKNEIERLREQLENVE